MADIALAFDPTPPSTRAPRRAGEPAGRLHRRLSAFNRTRLDPALPSDPGAPAIDAEADQQRAERSFVERERADVAGWAAEAPRDPAGFVAWFEALKDRGPGQNDRLFPWLAEQANAEQMRWFLAQEVAGEAGFDDLVALTQLKLPTVPKLEMARNYWDEMGRGNAKGMHGPMLGVLARAFGLERAAIPVVWESLALGNLMIALAANRGYAYHSVGALGVIELTAPTRAVHVARALKRLGLPAAQRHYFDLHAILDVKHSDAWNREVLAPLVAARPAVAPAIAEGALMRLAAGARCFRRYRRQFAI